MATVEQPDAVTEELLEAVSRLVSQLSSSAPPPTQAELGAILASPTTTLLIARDDEGPGGAEGAKGAKGAVIGMLTVAVFRIPTGVRAWIEDVVVDVSGRGHGVGEALSRRALEIAAEAGAKTVELTSRPSREAANRLYRRVGFQARETNVYRYQHDQT